jgi:hypothetical protein
MINNLDIYLTAENIFLIANWGVLPFWFMLLAIPNHSITRFFVHSIIPILLLASSYIFLSYKIYLQGNIFDSFNLYLGLDNLYAVFADEIFLLVFWLHFLSISLFIGAWISRDSQKYLIPRIITFFSLIIVYFTGPVGLAIYWFFRIFFSKKINFND